MRESGTIETLTSKQYECICKLRETFKKELMEFPELNTRWCLLRFCRARNFDIHKIEHMMRNMFEWRHLVDFKRIFSKDHSEYIEIEKCCVSGCYNVDRVGRPVFIERLGLTDINELLKDKYAQLKVDYFIQRIERQIFIQLPLASQLAGRRIDKIFMIMDFKGVSTSMLIGSKFKGFLRFLTKFSQDYYPELLGKCIIVNAPFVIKFLWTMVKLWLDKKTTDKIEIHNSLPVKRLTEYIDPENLPYFFGGKCQIPLNENPGPWRDEIERSRQNKTPFLIDRAPEYKYFYVDSDFDVITANQNTNKTSINRYVKEGSQLINNKGYSIRESKVATTRNNTYLLDSLYSDEHNKVAEVRVFKSLLRIKQE